ANFSVYGQGLTIKNLDADLESRLRSAFQYGLLGAPPSRLVVSESDCLYAADQIDQRGILEQVVQSITVGSANQHYTALGNSAGSGRLLLGANLVDNNHFRGVIFYSLDHH